MLSVLLSKRKALQDIAGPFQHTGENRYSRIPGDAGNSSTLQKLVFGEPRASFAVILSSRLNSSISSTSERDDIASTLRSRDSLAVKSRSSTVMFFLSASILKSFPFGVAPEENAEQLPWGAWSDQEFPYSQTDSKKHKAA